jgi:hypothetical protein
MALGEELRTRPHKLRLLFRRDKVWDVICCVKTFGPVLRTGFFTACCKPVTFFPATLLGGRIVELYNESLFAPSLLMVKDVFNVLNPILRNTSNCQRVSKLRRRK